jgi:hypothetical protein
VGAHDKDVVGAVLNRVDGKRLAGVWASLVAAYALVLNVVLSGVLLAPVSPATFEAGFSICVNSSDSTVIHDDSGKTTGKSVARCPLCLGHQGSILPPIPTTTTEVRFAVAIDLDTSFEDAFVGNVTTSAPRARAPPRFG